MKTFDFNKTLVHILLIILLGLIAYSNTFDASFHFDDELVIVKNRIIRDLRFFIYPSQAADFREYFEYDIFIRRYITYLTFALNYKLHGLDVEGYHAVNFLIHILNAIIIYSLVNLTFQTPFLRSSPLTNYSRFISLFTALLFTCHPIQTQAVTYIWQRATSLSALLYLLSVLTYVRFRLGMIDTHIAPVSHPSRAKLFPLYIVSVVAAVLAMKTKENAFMLPFAIALYESIFLKGGGRMRITYLVPFFLTALIVPLSLVEPGKPLGELIGDADDVTRGASVLSRWEYLFTEFRVIITYIRLVFFPVAQNLDYDYPTFGSFFDPQVFISFLFLAFLLLAGLFVLYRYRNSLPHTRILSFSIFWFFINLFPESSVVPLNNVIFEHRMYLPSFGIFLLTGTSLFVAVDRLSSRRKWTKNAAVWILIIVPVVITPVSYFRNSVWKDEVTLWKDVVRKSPNSPRGHNNLCNAYNATGDFEKAAMHCRIAIKLRPGYMMPRYNLGIAYQSQNALEKAIQQYKAAVKLDPDYLDAYNNLGNVYQSQGLIDKAIQQYMKVIDLNPGYHRGYNNLGNAYFSQGLIDKAIEQYRICIALNPDFPDAHYNLGNAYFSQGLTDKAIEQYRISIALNPDSPDAHYNLGSSYLSQGLTDKAIEQYRISIALNPDSPDVYYNLGNAYFSQGQIEKAIQQYKRALSLNPDYVEAHNKLGTIYRSKGLIDRAEEHFRMIRDLKKARDKR